MRERRTGRTLGRRGKVTIAAPVHLLRRVGFLPDELVRIFLKPPQRALGAENSDVEIIFLAARNLRGEEKSLSRHR